MEGNDREVIRRYILAFKKRVVAASGGIGGGPSSLWIFKLANYAALDRLFHDEEDPVAGAYRAFFGEMVDVQDMVREEVIFL